MSNQTLQPYEIVARLTFGVILVASFFLTWGKWLALGVGVLFIVSAFVGGCVLCLLTKPFYQKKCCSAPPEIFPRKNT